MSQVLERQVSEGYSPDGRIFEPPKTNQDNERPRYLAFIGSLVDPEIARSRWWTKGGGIEIANPCLRYVKNFIRKGRITPLLKDTHDFLPFNYVEKMVGTNPLGAGYFAQPIPQGYTPPALPPAQGQFQPGFGNLSVGGPSPYGNLVGRLALPGEQIASILSGPENLTQTNIQRGVVELISLAGHPYQPRQIDEVYVDPTIWQIQRAIFPTYPVLPVLLDDLERLLDDAEQHTSIQSVVAEMHESVIQFRDYADATIQNVHHAMRESAGRQGYVFRYTSMDLVLLEQLGAERQDRQIRQAAASTVEGDPEVKELLKAFFAAQTEEKLALAAMHKAQTPQLVNTEGVDVDETTMMAQPPEVKSDSSLIAGDAGQPGQEGTSGTSGASGQATEYEFQHAQSATGAQVLTNVTPESQEQMAEAIADTEPQFKCDYCKRPAASLAGKKAHERACEAAKATE